ncbi:MAG: DNA cytosine methyltransferase [Bacteroidota bacterium]
MKEPINVLSTFNGMGCIWVALDRLGVKVNKRYSSETDRYANIINDKNYPHTTQLGDVAKVKAKDLEKIDLLVGGSPCQGFSFAGKQLNFNDTRSKLFFEFVRLLEECREINPQVKFLLENVKMKKEYQDVISRLLGIEPIEINSSLVSGQNRRRLYWTNIDGIIQPLDRRISLSSVLQPYSEISETLMTEGWYKWWDKNMEFQLSKKHSSLDADKAICMTARQYASWNGNYVTLDILKYFRDTDKPLVFKARNKKKVYIHKEDLKPGTFYETRTEKGKTLRREARQKGLGDTTPRTSDCKKYVVSPHEKANCILATRSFLDCIIDNQFILRSLSPVECERLQTLPDNYTEGVSNSQRYKMLGNGWTVDVIAEILKHEYHKLKQVA